LNPEELIERSEQTTSTIKFSTVLPGKTAT